MSKYSQFFQDDKGNRSIARLLVYYSFVLVAIVIICLLLKMFLSSDYKEIVVNIVNLCYAILTAFVVQYGIGKTNETASKFGGGSENNKRKRN